MSTPHEFQTLVERRDWLAARIQAKRSVGRETQYDEREHNALCWAIDWLLRIRDHQCFIDERDDDARFQAHREKGTRSFFASMTAEEKRKLFEHRGSDNFAGRLSRRRVGGA